MAVRSDLAALAGGAASRSWRQVLCETEVDELEVAVCVEKDILGLKVPVGNVDDIVQVGEDEGDFGGVELDSSEGESTCTTEIGEYLSTGSVLELDSNQLAAGLRTCIQQDGAMCG